MVQRVKDLVLSLRVLAHGRGAGSIPGLGTSVRRGCGQKKKKKNQKQTIDVEQSTQRPEMSPN